MSKSHAEAVARAEEVVRQSMQKIDEVSRFQALAHTAFNDAVKLPRSRKVKDVEREALRLAAVSSYEALLDALCLHSDNLLQLAKVSARRR